MVLIRGAGGGGEDGDFPFVADIPAGQFNLGVADLVKVHGHDRRVPVGFAAGNVLVDNVEPDPRGPGVVQSGVQGVLGVGRQENGKGLVLHRRFDVLDLIGGAGLRGTHVVVLELVGPQFRDSLVKAGAQGVKVGIPQVVGDKVDFELAAVRGGLSAAAGQERHSQNKA